MSIHPIIEEEIWKDVVGSEDYQVSNLGRVRSIDKRITVPNYTRFLRGRILRPGYPKGKYPTVSVVIDGRRRTRELHRLVAEAFIPNPNGLPWVGHKNDIKTDNRAQNLEWCTRRNNIDRAMENDRVPKGNRHWSSILKEEDIPIIRMRLARGDKIRHIALDYGVVPGVISNIKAGIVWKHIL